MNPLSIAAIGWLMGSLVSKAVTELLEAWAKRKGLGKEFKTLKDQLLQLDALLTSAHSLHTNNRFLEKLIQDLQQLAYQAENLLDELDYYRLKDQIQQRGTQEIVNCSNKSLVASSSSGQLLASYPIMSTLEGLYIHAAPYAPVPLPETSPSQINLSRRMKELAEELQKSEEKVRHALQTESLVNISRKTEATNLPQTSPFHTESREVVGRNEERDQLLNLLTNEESATAGKVLVLAIVGCGGLGKTTLAGVVFNDPNIESCFDVRSWICVSTRFDIVRLTREMLEGACGNSNDKFTNLQVLQKKIKDKLATKTFLLVLDDMWEDIDQSQWNSMIALLNNCMVKRGIILVTTRNQSVAKMVDARDIIYLEGLDKDVFLSFFSTCIFNDPNYGGNWRLRKIGQEIADKLKGNPLAAKTVSALLKNNPDERYWMEIRDSEEWKFECGRNDIMPALQLSYEHMSFHLQRCFSYCAILPEDHPFTCEELVYQWMAHGYLDVISKGKRMEDIGRTCFNDLFNRGFFQTIQSRYDNEVHYTFHDLIHVLACVVSFKECFSINGAKTKEIPQTIRHLSIFNSTKMAENEEAIVTALESLEGENLSTIFNWDELPSLISCSIFDLLKKTKFLRAVRFDLCGSVQLHDCNFQNFVSLRYLKLIMSNFGNGETLPSEICRLYHLEVFEIEGGWFLDELPNNFSDLVSLRHFIVEGKLHSKILGVGKLTSLQELNCFHVQQNNGFEIEQLGTLKEIRGSLHISKLENVKSKAEANKARLGEKKKLDALYLKWNHDEQESKSVLEGLKPNTNLKLLEIDGYGGVASPPWLDSSLIFLESLTLKNCKAWELLPSIGELEFLKYLKLSIMAVREIGPQCYGTRQSMKFPSLEELEITDMPDLKKWVWNDQLQQFLCFKKLKKLTIRGCPKLVDLRLSRSATSEVMERFPSLEILEIEDCPLIEVLDFHSFVALEYLGITKCESLTSLTFGDQLVCLMGLDIISCKTLSSIKGLKSWVNLKLLHFQECPGFIAAWDSASREIERTKSDFSLSLTIIFGDSLALLTLPICKQLTSLQYFCLEVSAFTEEHEVSLQLLTSIDLVNIEGCKKNIQSFPFDLFPSLRRLYIRFPHIDSLPTSSCTEITDEYKKLRNIQEAYFHTHPLMIEFKVSSEEMICQQMDADN